MRSLLLTLITLSILISTEGQAQLSFRHACKKDEQWMWKGPASQAPAITNLAKKCDGTLQDQLAILNDPNTKNIPGFQAYLTGKFFWKNGLPHLAFEEFKRAFDFFNEITATPHFEAQFAALQCMTELQKTYPSLKPGDAFVHSLSPLLKINSTATPEESTALRLYFLLLLTRGEVSPANYPSELKKYVAEQTDLALSTALEKASDHADAPSVYALTNALHARSKLWPPQLFKPVADLAELNLGRLYFSTGKYEEAALQAEEILKKFPSDADAMELLSWSDYKLKKLDGAVAHSFALRAPSLAGFFSPKSTLFPAMLYLENCDYQNAKNQLEYFRVKYRKENAYLLKSGNDYYADFIASLQNKGNVPPKVLSSWISNLTVLSLIAEDNALVDEKPAALKLQTALGLLKDAGLKNEVTSLTSSLVALNRNVDAIGIRNLRQIKTLLARKVQSMKVELDDASENASLMEVDILVGLSQEISMANPNDQSKAPAPAESKKRVAAKWNWEKRDSTHMDHDEIWADELGSLNAEVENQCKSL
jgi:hypothetical protein